MKKYLILAVIVFAMCDRVNAVTLTGVPNGNVISIYLNGGSLNGQFDTIGLSLTPRPGAAFQNNDSGLNAGVPRAPGEQFTYYNRMLGEELPADPDNVGGLGWVILGLTSQAPKNTPTELSFGGSPLGRRIDTSGFPGQNLFLANVLASSPGQVQGNIRLLRAGFDIQVVNLEVIPEPSAGLLVVLGMSILPRAQRRLAHRRGHGFRRGDGRQDRKVPRPPSF